MRHTRKLFRLLTVLLAAIAISACGGGGGGGGGGGPTVATFNVSLNTSGVGAGEMVTIVINGTDVEISGDGLQTILTGLASGTGYNVAIQNQSISVSCDLSQTSGTVTANVMIDLTCVPAMQFTVSGNVSGLPAGESVGLALGADTLALDSDGAFTFPTALFETESYDITVTDLNLFIDCTVVNGQGTANANVDDVLVSCLEKVRVPSLVYDVNDRYIRNFSESNSIIPLNGGVLFGGGDSANTELWFSDGTQEGSRLVLDINPDGSSNPSFPVEVNGIVYFGAEVANNQYRLWRTDGSTAGTWEVSDVALLDDSVIKRFGNEIVFIATDDASGEEIWISDGTSAGTRMLAEIVPGDLVGPTETLDSAELGGNLIFGARDGNDLVFEVWVSDGTDLGTVQITDFETDFGSGQISLSGFTAYAGRVYFWIEDLGTHANYALWRTDGTALGTEEVANFAANGTSGQVLGIANGLLYFSASEPGGGAELMQTNGTTIEIIDANPLGASQPTHVVGTSAGTYFKGINPAGHEEIWLTQGTTATTQSAFANPDSRQIKPLEWAFNDSYVYILGADLWLLNGTTSTRLLEATSHPVVFQGVFSFENQAPPGARLFFPAQFADVGQEVWVSDGTAPGTMLAVNSSPEDQTANGISQILGETADGLYFAATSDTYGRDLWVSDGTGINTIPQELVPGASFDVSFSGILGENVVFSDSSGSDNVVRVAPLSGGSPTTLVDGFLSEPGIGSDPYILKIQPLLGGIRPYLSDLTASGTSLVSSLAGSNPIEQTHRVTEFNGGFIFLLNVDGDLGIYNFDPSLNSLEFISDRVPLIPGPDRPLARLGDQFVFSSFVNSVPARGQLWATDGTAVGTQMILDQSAPGPSSVFSIGEFALFSNTSEFGTEPWVTDGTAEGTRILLDIAQRPLGAPGNDSDYSSNPFNFENQGGVGYFQAIKSDPAFTLGIWRTDGTPEGTKEIPLSGITLLEAYSFTEVDGLLYFLGSVSGDIHVYVSDGVGETRLVSDQLVIRPHTRIFVATQGAHADLYVQGDLGDTGWELHRLSVP